jgi:hypothetical protein
VTELDEEILFASPLLRHDQFLDQPRHHDNIQHQDQNHQRNQYARDGLQNYSQNQNQPPEPNFTSQRPLLDLQSTSSRAQSNAGDVRTSGSRISTHSRVKVRVTKPVIKQTSQPVVRVDLEQRRPQLKNNSIKTSTKSNTETEAQRIFLKKESGKIGVDLQTPKLTKQIPLSQKAQDVNEERIPVEPEKLKYLAMLLQERALVIPHSDDSANHLMGSASSSSPKLKKPKLATKSTVPALIKEVEAEIAKPKERDPQRVEAARKYIKEKKMREKIKLEKEKEKSLSVKRKVLQFKL